MIPAEVRYHRATSLEDALVALAEPDSRALAGGQSLIPVMKLRIARPELVVDIGRLELAGIDVSREVVRLGALTTWDELTKSSVFAEPALAAMGECAAGIGDLQVRNRGTLGGSLAHADPASDLPAVALALGATVTTRSPDGERSIDAGELVVGPFITALGPQELITSIALPVPPPGSGSAYEKIEHPASGFALAGAAALVRSDGSTSVALTGVSSRPLVLASEGDPEAALDDVEVLGDRSAPADYRRVLAAVVVRRALEKAGARAQGMSS